MSRRRKSKEERQQYIFALKQLVSREIKRKYARSYLGIVWSVLNPLLTMAVMSMIFSTIFKRSIVNFPIYYLTGTILWGFFSQGTNAAMTALVDNKNLLLKVKLTKQTFILSRVFTAFANLGYTFIAYVFMLVVFTV
ncbi:MAG: ABC transporter permease, partial [Lachnospiraceae bacterium]|nr:ABC transporter permease [Lachnospiraceae bacterium]